MDGKIVLDWWYFYLEVYLMKLGIVYEMKGLFFWFEIYYVEGCIWVKCISGVEEVFVLL